MGVSPVSDLQVIVGCMFSGKSGELLRRVRRQMHAGREYQLFKPAIDNRYSAEAVASHDGDRLPATIVKDYDDLWKKIEDKPVYAIDEVQFLDSRIIDLCVHLRKHGKLVIVAGLLTDFRGEYFPFTDGKKTMADLIKHGHTKQLRAVCKCDIAPGEVCGGDADFTQRIINGKPAPYDSPIIMVGAAESYEARCINHHEVPGRP